MHSRTLGAPQIHTTPTGGLRHSAPDPSSEAPTSSGEPARPARNSRCEPQSYVFSSRFELQDETTSCGGFDPQYARVTWGRFCRLCRPPKMPAGAPEWRHTNACPRLGTLGSGRQRRRPGTVLLLQRRQKHIARTRKNVNPNDSISFLRQGPTLPRT